MIVSDEQLLECSKALLRRMQETFDGLQKQGRDIDDENSPWPVFLRMYWRAVHGERDSDPWHFKK